MSHVFMLKFNTNQELITSRIAEVAQGLSLGSHKKQSLDMYTYFLCRTISFRWDRINF